MTYYAMPMVAYAPVAMAPAQATERPAAGLGDIVELIKAANELREAFGSRGSETRASSGDFGEIKRGIAELKEGQEDLRGRMINNAGISRSIGEEIVKTHARVAAVETAIGANGELVRHLVEINKTLNERLPDADAAPAAAGAPSKHDELEAKVKTLSDEMKAGFKSLNDLIEAKLKKG